MRLHSLVAQIATLRRRGIELVVVTSGAVGAGMEALGIRERPTVVSTCRCARRLARLA